MTMLHAVARRGRFHIVKHRWGGYHAIDTQAELPISRMLGNFPDQFKAWAHIEGLS